MGFVCKNNLKVTFLWFIYEPRTPFQKKLNSFRWMSDCTRYVSLAQMKEEKRTGCQRLWISSSHYHDHHFLPGIIPIQSPAHCAALMFKHWHLFGLHSHFFEWCSFRNTPWERSGSNIFKPFADFLTNSSNFLMRRHFQTNLLKDCMVCWPRKCFVWDQMGWQWLTLEERENNSLVILHEKCLNSFASQFSFH